MRLLDKLALNKAATMIIGLIVSLLKIFIPKIGEDLDKNNPIPPMPRPPIRKRGRPRKESNNE